ncbi:MAG: chemotaxis protein CheW [Verrucomicrobiota bacterium]
MSEEHVNGANGEVEVGNFETRSYAEEFVVFARDSRFFAMSTEVVSEVIEWRQPTRVPQSPAILTGVLNLRGQMLSVIACDSLLGGTESQATEKDAILVTRYESTLLGLIVDRVQEVSQIPTSDVHSNPLEVARPHYRGLWHNPSRNALVTILDGRRLIEEAFSAFAQESKNREINVPTIGESP